MMRDGKCTSAAVSVVVVPVVVCPVVDCEGLVLAVQLLLT